MSIHRKLFATWVSLAALAAVPAIASASPVLTENGAAVAVGSKILATNSGNIVLTTNAGVVTCTLSTLTGTVEKNNGAEIEETIETASFTGAGVEGRCKSTFLFNPEFKVTPENLHWCLRSAVLEMFTVRGGGCNEAAKNLRFTLDSAFGNCTYEREHVTGTYKANVVPVTLKLDANQVFRLVAGGNVCPEKGTLSGGWTLETDVSPFAGLEIS